MDRWLDEGTEAVRGIVLWIPAAEQTASTLVAPGCRTSSRVSCRVLSAAASLVFPRR